MASTIIEGARKYICVPTLKDETGDEIQRTTLTDNNYERWYQEMETMLKAVHCWDYKMKSVTEPSKRVTMFYLGREVTLLGLIYSLISETVKERLVETGRMGVCEVWEWLTLTKGQRVELQK